MSESERGVANTAHGCGAGHIDRPKAHVLFGAIDIQKHLLGHQLVLSVASTFS